MSTDLFRLVYCSRNTLGSSSAIGSEIDHILATSRANNARAGVTGALLHSDGCFAQALEGPLESVQTTFERIQRDLRHTDVVVLGAARTDHRLFGNWSMALAGTGRRVNAGLTLSRALSAKDGISGADVLALLDDLIVREADWAVAAE